jgi:hypothetical protein
MSDTNYLPIMQPIKFDFVINQRAAKGLGLDVPDRLLALGYRLSTQKRPKSRCPL